MSGIAYGTFNMIFNGKDLDPKESMGWTERRDASVLLALSQFFRPKRYLEIGIYEGGTSALLLRNSPWIEEYIGIDIKPECATFTPSVTLKNSGHLAMSDSRYKVLLRDKGPDPILTSGEFDMIFIDGDHTYEGVSYDTAIAQMLLRDHKGVLIWHDYGVQFCEGVTRYIDERNKNLDRTCRVDGSSVCFDVFGSLHL